MAETKLKPQSFYMPYCFVHLASDFTIANSTNTPIQWDTEDSDSPGWFTSSAPTRITVTSAGIYLITSTVTWASNTTGNRIAQFTISGANTYGKTTQATNVTGNSLCQNISLVAPLVAGNYIEVVGYQGSTATLAVRGGTEWSCFRVIKLTG